MAKRPLHDILCEVLGSRNCYFEPPDGKDMNYPCIVYNYTNDDTDFADNIHYRESKRYTVTIHVLKKLLIDKNIIDDDPDSRIPSRLKKLPYCSSDRNFASDGLSHFVYTLFYSGPRIKEEENNE